ncbi:MAG: hypothetical protein NTY09_09640 [bacterium]|nr:hypothetical protein [bacterium]
MTMYRLLQILVVSLILFSCYGNDKVSQTPESVVSTEESPIAITFPKPYSGHTYLLGCYEINVNPVKETLEIEKNRSIDYGLFVSSFMRELPLTSQELSANSISFDKQDPDSILLDVDFQWMDPWPSDVKYQLYDFLGVIQFDSPEILALDYLDLTYPQLGNNITVLNADTYTEWFNMGHFVRSAFFGQPPPGKINHSWANIGGIYPAKYYSDGLSPEEDLWNFQAIEGETNQGFHQYWCTRQYELLLPKNAIDSLGYFYFIYIAMARWNDRMDSPYTPCHREEAIASSVIVTDNIYYNGTESGGNLILDIGLWAWDEQPSAVMIESTVFSSTKTVTDPPRPGGDNYSIYHFDEPIDMPLDSTEGQEFWVIAESSGYTYGLQEGLNGYGSANPLAAFFRYPLYVSSEPQQTE